MVIIVGQLRNGARAPAYFVGPEARDVADPLAVCGERWASDRLRATSMEEDEAVAAMMRMEDRWPSFQFRSEPAP